MQEPPFAKSVVNRPAEDEVRDNVRHQNAKTGVLQVFGGQQQCQNTLHKELSVCSLELVLLINRKVGTQCGMGIERVVDFGRFASIGQNCM